MGAWGGLQLIKLPAQELAADEKKHLELMMDRDLSAWLSQESVRASISARSCSQASLLAGPSRPATHTHNHSWSAADTWQHVHIYYASKCNVRSPGTGQRRSGDTTRTAELFSQHGKLEAVNLMVSY